MTGPIPAAPQYRAVAGAAKWFNKIYGWMPVVFDSASLEVQCTHSKMSQSAGEIEVLVRKAKEGQPIRANASPNLQREVSNGLGMPVEVAIFFDEAQIAGVAERIRNKILDTALALEAEGIVGDGMSFSPDEKKKAAEASVTYNIGNITNFAGSIGSASGSATIDVKAQQHVRHAIDLQKVADFSRVVRDNLTALDGAEREQIESDLQTIDRELQCETPKPSVIKSALTSVGKAASTLTGWAIHAYIDAQVKGLTGGH